MFEEKKNSLGNIIPSNKDVNLFISDAEEETLRTLSGNGSTKYITSGNVFVDDFAALANYLQPRTYNEVAKTMSLQWSINPTVCVKQALYCRLISRTCVLATGEKISNQKGQGLKAESIWRFMWILLNHKEVFFNNIKLIIAAGCFNDLIEILSLDLQYNGYKDKKTPFHKIIGQLIYYAKNPKTSELVKKYMPSIRVQSRCKTVESQAHRIIAVELAKRLFPKSSDCNKQYRKFKSSGKAHEWQKLISQGRQQEIDFNTIPGRALHLLTTNKSLSNWDMEDKYLDWIESKEVAKFTGYAHELFKSMSPRGSFYSLPIRQQEIIENTVNKQFAGLVQDVNEQSPFLVALDVSGSMTGIGKGTKMTSYDIGLALALYFSYSLHGAFENHLITFSDTPTMREFKGNTPSDKFLNFSNNYFGSTEFLSIAELFADLKNTVPEEDFPKGVLCVSDGEFNYSGTNISNFKAFRQILTDAGFSKDYVDNFKLVLWDIPNDFYHSAEAPKFESFADAPNNFYMSGYDGSIVSFLFGKDYNKPAPKNANELYKAVMDQELLNRVKI